MFWDFLEKIFPVLFIIALIAFTLARSFRMLGFFDKPLVRLQLNEQERKTLNDYILFYRQLPLSKKTEFEKRVWHFREEKVFETRYGLPLRNEMTLLIAATAVQLTFGFKNYLLPHFAQIIIYPEAYFSIISKRYHKGEVNLQGVIVISWKDFLEGIKHPNDAFHVGIHEFAHAVYFENFIENLEYLFIDRPTLNKFFNEASGEMKRMRENLPGYIRDYAGTNKQEFFAVTTEYFFEQPIKFREKLPALYAAMCKVYNQDTGAMVI